MLYWEDGKLMAYLRKEDHVVEIDYPVRKVWNGILEIITKLKWTLEKSDKETFQIKVNTTAGLLLYASMFFIKLKVVDKKTTLVKINVETPVTTITALTVVGRIGDRIELFFEALSIQLNRNKEVNAPEETD